MLKGKVSLRAGLLLLITGYSPTGIADDELQKLAKPGKELIRKFSEQLQSEYKKAGNNPEYIMKVCRIAAPEIAAELSKDGWNIRRISLNYRNQNNAPDRFEEKILEDFEKKKSGGWSVDQLAYFKMKEVGNQSEIRYLKAITVEGLCLTCHASTLPGKSIQPGELKSGDIYGAYAVKKLEIKDYLQEPAQPDEHYTLPEYQESKH